MSKKYEYQLRFNLMECIENKMPNIASAVAWPVYFTDSFVKHK